MKITYLGTAAAEGLPALFCQCPVCEHARKVLGKEFRSRSGALINDDLMIDISPDIYHSTIRAGVSLPDVKHIIMTHSHEDHCDAYELSTRYTEVTCKRRPECVENLHVYGCRAVEKVLNISGNNGIDFTYVEPFKSFYAGGVKVTPMLAEHIPNEVCYIYLIEQNGKSFIYGNDTGVFPAETMEFLKGKYTDAISLDCTYVMMKFERGHMGIEADEKMKNLLIAQGTADENTIFIAHHFSHNGFIPNGRLYSLDEFEKIAGDKGFLVSYDTMTFSI